MQQSSAPDTLGHMCQDEAKEAKNKKKQGMDVVVINGTEHPFLIAPISTGLIILYTVISCLSSSLLALERKRHMPSCLYDHMNYQERKGWLTLDSVKWRKS